MYHQGMEYLLLPEDSLWVSHCDPTKPPTRHHPPLGYAAQRHHRSYLTKHTHGHERLASKCAMLVNFVTDYHYPELS